MDRLPDRAVCPSHDKCDDCGNVLGGLPSLAHVNTDTGARSLFHVMCAPPRLRKAYHEAQGQVARGR